MELKDVVREMSRYAREFPRINRVEPIEYGRRWGDCRLTFTLSVYGWRLSIRREGAPPSAAQLYAFRKAFGVPEGAKQENVVVKVQAETWHIRRYLWQPEERLLEIKELVGLQ